MKAVVLACIALMICGAVHANDAAAAVQDFSVSLSQRRDACSQLAKDAAEKASTDEFQASLDSQNAVLQARMDANVYAVGHGERETRDYFADRLEAESKSAADKSQAIATRLADDSSKVKACVAAAIDAGKASFISFKKIRANKRSIGEAESLFTAWLTNVQEISTDQPQGSAASLAAWKAARSHAEVSAL